MAQQIRDRHQPGERQLFRGPGDQVISIDDSGRCQGCEATGWRTGYIMPWPCDAWKMATAILELSRQEGAL